MSIPRNKHELEYCARMNVFYHEARERTHGRYVRWTSCLSVIFSSAAAVALSELFFPEAKNDAGRRLAIIFGFATTVGNGLALAFNWNSQATVHARLRAKWLVFSMEVHLADEDKTEEFEKLLVKLSQLNIEEPPPIDRVLLKAVAATSKALGRDRATA